MESPAPRPLHDPRHRAMWICFAVVTVILLGIIGWGIYMTTKSDPHGAVARFTQQHPPDFTVFYPATPPEGFKLDETSAVSLEGTGLQFALVGGQGKKILVTQQRRPTLMEEVNKTQEFTTPAGKGYTAELNNRVAGFLVTADTLVIATSPEQIDPTVLRKVIESMTPL